MAKQLARTPRLHADDTYEEHKELRNSRIAGSMQTSSYFNQLPFVTSATPQQLELFNAVIVAVRIHAGAKLGD